MVRAVLEEPKLACIRVGQCFTSVRACRRLLQRAGCQLRLQLRELGVRGRAALGSSGCDHRRGALGVMPLRRGLSSEALLDGLPMRQATLSSTHHIEAPRRGGSSKKIAGKVARRIRCEELPLQWRQRSNERADGGLRGDISSPLKHNLRVS